MDFLEKLYSNENFGLYLIIAIAVLVVLFFIVLFLGKKDEKKTKELKSAKEKEKQLVQNNTTEPIAITPLGNDARPFENNNEVQSVSSNLDNSNLESATFTATENIKPEENNISAFKEVTEEAPVEIHKEAKLEEIQNNILNENNVNEESEDEDKEFDFEALADAINKELESIKENKNDDILSNREEEKPVIEEKPFSFPTFETIEPDKIPEQVISKEKEEIKPVIDDKQKMPNVFSSVYVNSNDEINKPIKPSPFELPKMADLPKKAEENKEELKDDHSFLDKIEAESYRVDK